MTPSSTNPTPSNNSSWKLMPPHSPLERYYTRNTKGRGERDRWDTTPRHSTPLNETTTFMTENSWPLSEALKIGGTSSLEAPTPLSSLRTITISNIGATRNELIGASPATSYDWRTT